MRGARLAIQTALAKWRTFASEHELALSRLELTLGLAIVAFAAPLLVTQLYEMATTSLWNDELYTIMHFSSQGMIASITDYHVPNNHVLAALFLVANSLKERRWIAFPLILSAAIYFPQLSSNRLHRFHFVPIENWRAVAGLIEGTFPARTQVCAPFRNHFLRAYLDPSFPIGDNLSTPASLQGKQIHVDSDFWATRRFDPNELGAPAITVEVPQQ